MLLACNVHVQQKGLAASCLSQPTAQHLSPSSACFTSPLNAGIIKPGEDVEIIGLKDATKTTVTGVEMFKKLLSSGQAGDNVGLLLRGVKREDVLRGQVRLLGGRRAMQQNQGAFRCFSWGWHARDVLCGSLAAWGVFAASLSGLRPSMLLLWHCPFYRSSASLVPSRLQHSLRLRSMP